MLIDELNEVVADCETDGIKATKIWCTSVHNVSAGSSTTMVDYAKMREFLSNPDMVLIGHNFYGYDKPTWERILGIEVKAFIVDTLGLSWYLYPDRMLHGLESWGEDFGVPKPVIDDWENQTLADYTHRCEEDVKINTKLWKKMKRDLKNLYGDDSWWHAVEHICFKMRCVALQEKCKWKLDVQGSHDLVKFFVSKIETSKKELEAVMPKVPVKARKSRPKKPYKKDGSLSATGLKWDEFTKERNLSFDYEGEVEYVKGEAEPNAGSHAQIKDWLYSLGWTPCTFDYKRNKETGDVKKIPQVKDKDTGELTASVKSLIEKQPELQLLEDLSVLTHRKSIVEGFLKDVDEDDYVVARAQGFTNTLRLRHKVCLNLPSLRKPYGKEIRGLLQARSEETELLGSDMSSLEDRTKQHYMWPHDPEYVKDMQRDDFDPHCDIAQEAGIMSRSEVIAYKHLDKNDLKEAVGRDGVTYNKKVLSGKRHSGKGTNYSATYGAGGATIARTAGVSEAIGNKLHKAYWDRNWSLKAIADECKVKQSRGLKWLWNPVAQMWYYLKKDKDKFSTLNQGTGTYCFDLWLKKILEKRPQLTGQFHRQNCGFMQ